MSRSSSLCGFILILFVFSYSHQIYGQELTKPDSLVNNTINKIANSYNSGDKEKALEQAQTLVNILQQLETPSNLRQPSIGINTETFFKRPGIRKIKYNPNTGVYYENVFITTGYFDKNTKQYTKTSRMYPYVMTSKTHYSSKKK
jgi:hypothetical protein